MAILDQWIDYQPIVLIRENCGKPTPQATAADVIANVMTVELTGDTTSTGTANRCRLSRFQWPVDTFSNTSTIIDNESDACWVGVICRKGVDENSIALTLLSCDTDEDLAERIAVLNTITRSKYEYDAASETYVRQKVIGSTTIPTFDLFVFECDPTTGEYRTAKIYYGLYLSEGSNIVKDYSSFSRTQEFVNTELTFDLPQGGCFYEQILNAAAIEAIFTAKAGKTPNDLLADGNNVPATLTDASPVTEVKDEKKTSTMTDSKKK